MKKIVSATTLLFLLAAALPLSGAARKSKEPAAAPASAPVDLNSASQKDLEALPGIGAATAKKIIAHRPYSSVQDLSRAGVAKATIDKIAPMVTASAGAAAAATPSRPKHSEKAATSTASPARSGPLDLNTASEADLEKLPGVGSAYARRIVDARPYASVADLSRARLPKKTLDKITPLVTVTGAGSASTPMGAGDQPMKTAPPPKAAPAPNAAPSTKEPFPGAAGAPRETTTTVAQTPPSPGMVWVNTETKVYHLEGDRWYGKTKHGKWMTESEAIQAGYRKAKR